MRIVVRVGSNFVQSHHCNHTLTTSATALVRSGEYLEDKRSCGVRRAVATAASRTMNCTGPAEEVCNAFRMTRETITEEAEATRRHRVAVAWLSALPPAGVRLTGHALQAQSGGPAPWQPTTWTAVPCSP
jgi:hypothetical protein